MLVPSFISLEFLFIIIIIILTSTIALPFTAAAIPPEYASFPRQLNSLSSLLIPQINDTFTSTYELENPLTQNTIIYDLHPALGTSVHQIRIGSINPGVTLVIYNSTVIFIKINKHPSSFLAPGSSVIIKNCVLSYFYIMGSVVFQGNALLRITDNNFEGVVQLNQRIYDAQKPSTQLLPYSIIEPLIEIRVTASDLSSVVEVFTQINFRLTAPCVGTGNRIEITKNKLLVSQKYIVEDLRLALPGLTAIRFETSGLENLEALLVDENEVEMLRGLRGIQISIFKFFNIGTFSFSRNSIITANMTYQSVIICNLQVDNIQNYLIENNLFHERLDSTYNKSISSMFVVEDCNPRVEDQVAYNSTYSWKNIQTFSLSRNNVTMIAPDALQISFGDVTLLSNWQTVLLDENYISYQSITSVTHKTYRDTFGLDMGGGYAGIRFTFKGTFENTNLFSMSRNRILNLGCGKHLAVSGAGGNDEERRNFRNVLRNFGTFVVADNYMTQMPLEAEWAADCRDVNSIFLRLVQMDTFQLISIKNNIATNQTAAEVRMLNYYAEMGHLNIENMIFENNTGTFWVPRAFSGKYSTTSIEGLGVILSALEPNSFRNPILIRKNNLTLHSDKVVNIGALTFSIEDCHGLILTVEDNFIVNYGGIPAEPISSFALILFYIGTGNTTIQNLILRRNDIRFFEPKLCPSAGCLAVSFISAVMHAVTGSILYEDNFFQVESGRYANSVGNRMIPSGAIDFTVVNAKGTSLDLSNFFSPKLVINGSAKLANVANIIIRNNVINATAYSYFLTISFSVAGVLDLRNVLITGNKITFRRLLTRSMTEEVLDEFLDTNSPFTAMMASRGGLLSIRSYPRQLQAEVPNLPGVFVNINVIIVNGLSTTIDSLIIESNQIEYLGDTAVFSIVEFSNPNFTQGSNVFFALNSNKIINCSYENENILPQRVISAVQRKSLAAAAVFEHRCVLLSIDSDLRDRINVTFYVSPSPSLSSTASTTQQPVITLKAPLVYLAGDFQDGTISSHKKVQINFDPTVAPTPLNFFCDERSSSNVVSTCAIVMSSNTDSVRNDEYKVVIANNTKMFLSSAFAQNLKHVTAFHFPFGKIASIHLNSSSTIALRRYPHQSSSFFSANNIADHSDIILSNNVTLHVEELSSVSPTTTTMSPKSVANMLFFLSLMQSSSLRIVLSGLRIFSASPDFLTLSSTLFSVTSSASPSSSSSGPVVVSSISGVVDCITFNDEHVQDSSLLLKNSYFSPQDVAKSSLDDDSDGESSTLFSSLLRISDSSTNTQNFIWRPCPRTPTKTMTQTKSSIPVCLPSFQFMLNSPLPSKLFTRDVVGTIQNLRFFLIPGGVTNTPAPMVNGKRQVYHNFVDQQQEGAFADERYTSFKSADQLSLPNRLRSTIFYYSEDVEAVLETMMANSNEGDIKEELLKLITQNGGITAGLETFDMILFLPESKRREYVQFRLYTYPISSSVGFSVSDRLLSFSIYVPTELNIETQHDFRFFFSNRNLLSCRIPSDSNSNINNNNNNWTMSTLSLKRRWDFLSPAAVAAANAIASVSASLTLPVDGALVASTVTQANALLDIFVCSSSKSDAPLDFLESPLGLSIGSSRGKFLRGGVLGNVIVLLIVGFALVGLAAFRFHRLDVEKRKLEAERDKKRKEKKKKRKQHQQRDNNTTRIEPAIPPLLFIKNFYDSLGAASFPSTVFIPLCALTQGTISSCVGLFFISLRTTTSKTTTTSMAQKSTATIEEELIQNITASSNFSASSSSTATSSTEPSQAFSLALAFLGFIFYIVTAIWVSYVVFWKLPSKRVSQSVKFRPTTLQERSSLPKTDLVFAQTLIDIFFPKGCEFCQKHLSQAAAIQETEAKMFQTAGKKIKNKKKNSKNNISASPSDLIATTTPTTETISSSTSSSNNNQPQHHRPIQHRGSFQELVGSWILRNLFFVSGVWYVDSSILLKNKNNASHRSRRAMITMNDVFFIERYNRFFAKVHAQAKFYPLFSVIVGICIGIISGVQKYGDSITCSQSLMFIVALVMAGSLLVIVMYRPALRSTANSYALIASTITFLMCIFGLVGNLSDDPDSTTSKVAFSAVFLLVTGVKFFSIVALFIDMAFLIFLKILPRVRGLSFVFAHYREKHSTGQEPVDENELQTLQSAQELHRNFLFSNNNNNDDQLELLQQEEIQARQKKKKHHHGSSCWDVPETVQALL